MSTLITFDALPAAPTAVYPLPASGRLFGYAEPPNLTFKVDGNVVGMSSPGSVNKWSWTFTISMAGDHVLSVEDDDGTLAQAKATFATKQGPRFRDPRGSY